MKFHFFDGAVSNLADAFEVRQIVFIDEQGFTPELEFDEIDEHAIHIVGYEEGKPVCTGRIFADEKEDTLHIGRICVLAEERGKGTGEQMLLALIAHAKAQGVKSVVLGAQVQATSFYGKIGFEKYGEIFYDEEVPHIMMELIL